jgi:hypothetical protein
MTRAQMVVAPIRGMVFVTDVSGCNGRCVQKKAAGKRRPMD